MLLALSVISGQGANLGASAYKIFDERGGSIGRLDTNDWALPDPDRWVSSKHAMVRFQSGAFCLEDVSTNGTFLNEPDRPVSKTEPVRLKDGDRLFIGDYEILVQLIEDGERVAEPGSAPIEAPSAAPVNSLGTDDPLAVIGVGAGIAGGGNAGDVGAGSMGAGSAGAGNASVSSAAVGGAGAGAAAAPADLPAPPGPPRPTAGPAPALEQGARDLLSALGLDARDVGP